MVVIGSGGIILRDNLVLLIERKNTKTYDRLWSNPGGSVESGETLEEAAIRELEEEVGIKTEVIEKLAKYLDHQKGKLIGKYTGYLMKITKGKPRIMEPNKINNLYWFPLDCLPSNLAPYTQVFIDHLTQDRKEI